MLPLILREAKSDFYLRRAREATVVTWWGSYVECAVALARHAREGNAPSQIAEAYRALDELADGWQEVRSDEKLRRAAVRAARLHQIRAADAFQLGAAMVACRYMPESARFAVEDRRLKAAAEREGFLVD